MQAMILAAGFGTRLRPYTELRPKPLFPVLNTPLLIATVNRLRNAGFSRIVVNCHHLGEQISDAVGSIPGVIVQYEPTILGTGGGLREACDKIEDAPLLVTNGDIYHSIDFTQLYDYHRRSGNDVTMAVHDCTRFNVLATEHGRIVDFKGRRGSPGLLAYTGVQVVNPGLLSGIKKSTASCIIEYYHSLLTNGRPIHVRRVDGSFWTDMGTPEDYLNLHRDLLTGAAPRWQELAADARPFCVDPAAHCDASVGLRNWAAIGKARIGAGATLARCVVWDGAVIDPGASLADRIVAPGQAQGMKR
ncbi:MAG: NTP transferase domain-containing protein [Desulfofustis sp.]|nr:NTP transferase domain-containing protein [Desulfofustis sp.]